MELCWKWQEISLSLDLDAKCSFQEFTPAYSNLLLDSVPAQPIPAERSSREEIGRFPERAGETTAGATAVPGAEAGGGWDPLGFLGLGEGWCGIRRGLCVPFAEACMG